MRLDSLHIKNYKLFKDLEIPKLGQVNLITGKNNTGKTILLEALRIWASEGDASVINNIIWKRGDWDPGSSYRTYISIITDRKVSNVKINELELVIEANSEYQHLTKIHAERRLVGIKIIGLDIANKEYPQDKAIYIPASIDFDNKKLWSNIDLTDKKDIVIQILQIIEPSIIDLGIIDNVARVRTKNSKIPVPLKNFGEGLNRLLTLAMALVSAEDNLLLIDEMDTGLHYSVLEKLWEIIFEYSNQLKTQVFVTTHSADCVESFTAVANQEKFKGVGNYLRLQRKRNSEEIIPIFYKEEELEIAVEQDIETR